MKPLSGKRVYLSGPIEYDLNSINWRPEVKEVLISRFSLNIFDPFDDPKQTKSDEMQFARETNDFDTVSEIAADFISKDLTEVDKSDLLIAHLPYKVPTVGTIHEIINAVNRKIPPLIVCPQGRKCVSSWIYGLFKKKHQYYIHGSWESLFSYLEEVNDKKHIDDRRWRYVYGMI